MYTITPIRFPRVRLTGSIDGDGNRDLQRAALAYIQATSVGGTHPELIEAMGAGHLVLAFRTPENVEVTAGTRLLFGDEAELAGHLRRVVEAPWSAEFEDLRHRSRARAEGHYSSDAVSTAYEHLWRRLGAG
jgi:glycosyltransferase involved in cell wall biosynthesis